MKRAFGDMPWRSRSRHTTLPTPRCERLPLQALSPREYADRPSDIDLSVYWVEPPTGKERRDIIKWSGGRRLPRFPSHAKVGGWSEEFEVKGIKIDVRHLIVEATERILADVLEHADPSLPKQRHIAALLCALPRSDPSMLTHWQQQALVYPHELSVAMVRAHLRFRPRWEREVLAERHDLLVLYESLCTIEKQILLVLMGLNRLYFPGWQWVDRLIAQMPIAPLPHLAVRCSLVFGIVSIDPVAAVYQLHDLVEETFQFGGSTSECEVDTSPARERFIERQRRAWEQAPKETHIVCTRAEYLPFLSG